MPSYPKPRRSKNKYSSVRQTYRGNSYHSKAEAKYAMYLDQRVKDKEIKGWKRQVKVELFGENKSHICNYYCDFLVEHLNGKMEYIEVKGMATAVFRLKKKLMEDKIKGLGKDKFEYTIVYV